jgi:hypothetical protein
MILPSIFHMAAGASPWVLAAVESALVLHIGGGSVGILSGYAAVSVRKGERLHRVFGTVFLLSMLTMAAMATSMAVLIPQRSNVLGGVLTVYLVSTAWMAVRRKQSSVGRFEVAALIAVLGLAAAAAIFGWQAAHSAAGQLDGYPSAAYFIVACFAGFLAALDLKLVLRGGISGAPRIARHLWRMGFALFFAAGSFFLGQQKVMPAFMHGSPFLFAPAIAPLVLMVFWLFRVRLTWRFTGEAMTSQTIG